MLINDKSQLKRNVEQGGFQFALKTSKSTAHHRNIILLVHKRCSHNPPGMLRSRDHFFVSVSASVSQ